MEKRILEEINRFKMISSYQPGKLITEQKLLNEETQWFGEDKYFMVIYKKNKKPKLVEIGTAFVKKNIFIPTKKGKEILGRNQDSITWSQLERDEKFQFYRKLGGGNGTIVSDYEVDEMVNQLIKQNNSYADEIESRLQQTKETNWNKTNSGKILLNLGSSLKYANAIYIKVDSHPEKLFNLIEGPIIPGLSELSFKSRSAGTKTEIIIPNVKLNETVNTYCDNMIKPNLENPDVKQEFMSIMRSIKKYVDTPADENGVTALSKLQNAKITIFGQADSGRPGWIPGYPCRNTTNDLDHNYGGLEKIPVKSRTEQYSKKMNEYLAENRAKQYGKLLSDEVKKLYGIDLNIQYTWKEYFGEGDSKRGEKWRSIELKFNTPVHTYVIGGDPEDWKSEGEKLNDEYKKLGYKWGISRLYTTQGVKKFSCLEKKGNLWCAQNNRLPLNESDKGDIGMLPKVTYTVNAKLEGIDLIIETSLGDIRLRGQKGAYGQTYDAGIQNALFDTWMRCNSADYSTISFPEPDKDAYYTYDPSDVINVLNENFYRVKAGGFIMFAMNCAAVSKPIPITDEEVAAELVKEKPIYNEKQLKFLSKQVDKDLSKQIKSFDKRNRPKGDNEEIQQDIQLK
jgi:hypothetical protein